MSDNQMPPMRGNDFDHGLRLGIQAALGETNSFNGDRDVYSTFGWPEDPDAEDYVALYLRNGYAKTVVDKPAKTTWRDNPIIKDKAETGPETQTEFESDIQSLEEQHNIWAYCERVDRCAGIVNHGLLLLGFQDVVGEQDNWGVPLSESSNSGLDDLNSLKPLIQTQIDDIDYGEPGSERWGQPEYYHLDLGDDIDEESEGEPNIYKVHWSRVIDVPSTRPLDDETIARPRIEPVLNNLLDIEKTLGSAAEQSYRGADYGLHINYDPEKVDPQAVEDSNVGEEFQNWYHGLQPQFTTVGGEVNTLGGEMQDPQPIVEENVNEICAETGIPKREFRGNQQGEQAGAEQDEKSFFGTISERREQYASTHIARQFIDRFKENNLISNPRGNGYLVDWPDLTQLSEAEEASLESDRSGVIKNLFSAGITLSREQAIEIVKSGEYPEFEEVQSNIDESNQEVWNQFNRQISNANRYSEGDAVSTPQGMGEVIDVHTDGTVGEMEATDSAPVYEVSLVENEKDESHYRASDIHSTDAEV